MIIDYGCDLHTVFSHYCNALLSQGPVKTFQLLFSFFTLKKISQVHQVLRPRALLLSFDEAPLSASSQSESSLSPDLNTAL